MSNGAEAGATYVRLQVGYIIGSLSTESINRTLVTALLRLAPKNLKFVEIHA
jgi:chromate reductase, NAD(P)H dehydrogenase (quinone)